MYNIARRNDTGLNSSTTEYDRTPQLTTQYSFHDRWLGNTFSSHFSWTSFSPHHNLNWVFRQHFVFVFLSFITQHHVGLSAPTWVVHNTPAYKHGSHWPIAASVLLNGTFVDDIHAVGISTEAALQCQYQLINLCAISLFQLQKWASNNN